MTSPSFSSDIDEDVRDVENDAARIAAHARGEQPAAPLRDCSPSDAEEHVASVVRQASEAMTDAGIAFA